MDEELDLLDIDGLAVMLGTTPQAIYNLRNRGDGPPASRVGRRLMWERATVRAWLKDRAAADADRLAERRAVS